LPAMGSGPNNSVALYRVSADGSYRLITPDAVRGPTVAVVVHGFSEDVRAMTALGSFLARFPMGGMQGQAHLYNDVVVFQYDSYHTPPASSAQALRDAVDRLPTLVQSVDLYGHGIGAAVLRYAYERLGVDGRLGQLVSRVVSLGGQHSGLPLSVAASTVAAVGLYVPTLLIPPPTAVLSDVSGGITGDVADPLRSAFFRDLNDSPGAARGRYYSLAGSDAAGWTPNAGSPAGVFALNEVQYQVLDGGMDPQSDGLVSMATALGEGVLESRSVTLTRAVVPVDHGRLVGLQSFLGPASALGAGVRYVVGALPDSVSATLTSWLSTF
jgi:hypothetical protein